MVNCVAEYIAQLSDRNIYLTESEGKISYKAVKGSVTKEDIEFLKDHKSEVIEYLKKDRLSIKDILKRQTKPPAGEKFSLTDIQQAYLTGRNNINYGGLSCQILIELKYDHMEPLRCEEVWNQLIKRHEMLRASFSPDGFQKVRQEWERFKVDFYDFSQMEAGEEKEHLNILRQERAGHQFDLEREYPFSISVIKLKKFSYMQFSIEFIVADWASIWMLISEFEDRYFSDRAVDEIPLKVSFHEYKLALDNYVDSIAYEKDKLFWKKRIDNLSSAPQIAILPDAANKPAKFRRLNLNIPAEKYDKFKSEAARYGITPTVALISAYAAVLKKWSSKDDFSLNLTVLNRFDAHEQIMDIVGDFTSTDILEINMSEENMFLRHALKVGKTLFTDMEHRLFSGVEVIREYAKQKGAKEALMPYVFTSAIGLTKTNIKGEMTEGCISSTPQVFIDCQAMDGDFGLNVNWDIREGVFEEGLVEKMFKAFEILINDLSIKPATWEEKDPVKLLEEDKTVIEAANRTDLELPKHLLHSEIIKRCKDMPERICCIQSEEEITYGELGRFSAGVANVLKKAGIRSGERIGVIIPKSIYQLYAVIGVLSEEGVYVPIDGSGAVKRRDEIIENCGITKVLTLSTEDQKYPAGIKLINVDKVNVGDISDISVNGNDENPAYIIHTSGSTGVPKGVVISHKGAVNTIEDINRRFRVTENDIAIGLSNLWFDLSVYDIFGILSVGGKICYPDIDRYTDPSHWNELVEKYGITIWNSVPAFMKIYVNYLNTISGKIRVFPRIIMLSGDWIGLKLFDEVKDISKETKCISLGGATEASIWSIFYEYNGFDKEWVSIPYGKPLGNQGFKVLDSHLRQKPIGVRGELYITGKGLALEYFKNKEATEKSFIKDPETGERMYKTGDYGRYMKDGNIEFLGRVDFQVKVHGYRIELGEIKNSINDLGIVKDCLVIATGEKDEEKSLYALVVIEGQEKNSELENKDLEKEILKGVRDRLPKYMLPKRVFFIEDCPLSANGKVDMKRAEEIVKSALLASKELKCSKERMKDAEDEIQAVVNEIWSEALNISCIDPERDLYEMGADSMIMGNVAGEVSKRFKDKVAFNEILVQMLNFPTTKELANYIRGAING